MEKYKKGDTITVYWDDAVLYGSKNIPYLEKLKPAKAITEGILEKENADFIILAAPCTVVRKFLHKKYVPKLSASGEKITFFYIPKGMISKVGKRNR